MISFLEKNINFFKFFFYFFFFLISFVNFFNINVSISIYLVFIFVSFLCLRNIFNLENNFGIIILSIFVTLGFWYKFTFITLLKLNFGEGVGYFDFSENSYNKVLIVTILFKSALIFGYIIYSKFNTRKYSINLIAVQNFFEKKKFFYLGIILIFILFVCYFNFYNKIYIRGFVFNENFTLYENLIKFFFKILASSLVYFSFDLILISKLETKKKFILIYILILVLSIIYLSQLSREFGLHIFIFIFSLILIQKNSKFKEKSKVNSVLIVFFLSFIISLYAIQNYRFKQIPTPDIDHQLKQSSIGLIFNKLGKDINHQRDNGIALIFNRWVGIDAVMSIVSYNSKSWELLYKIKNHEIDWSRQVAFPNSELGSVHVNIPGPAAFLYSSGSYIFLFFVSFVIFVIFFLLESIINLIKKKFVFLTNFLIFMLAYRIIQMGLGLNNLLYFILSEIIIVLFLLILNYFYKLK